MRKLASEIPALQGGTITSAAQSTWHKNVELLLADFYGPNSLVTESFKQISFSPGIFYTGQRESDLTDAMKSGLDEADGFLRSRIEDLAELTEETQVQPGRIGIAAAAGLAVDHRKVFIIHGHDHGIKETVARFLTKLHLEPIILHEMADQGRTVIEKFEDHSSQVGCAIALLTPDDIAESKASPGKKEFRARQNVVLELGYFVGKLGRNRTFALVSEGVTLPSDISGVIYIHLSQTGWEMALFRELKAAGLEVDANRLF
jgi:predicted nucleotide-binding protein